MDDETAKAREAGRLDAIRAIGFMQTIEDLNIFKPPELARIFAAYVASMPKDNKDIWHLAKDRGW
jgi:hypothetical protein